MSPEKSGERETRRLLLIAAAADDVAAVSIKLPAQQQHCNTAVYAAVAVAVDLGTVGRATHAPKADQNKQINKQTSEGTKPSQTRRNETKQTNKRQTGKQIQCASTSSSTSTQAIPSETIGAWPKGDNHWPNKAKTAWSQVFCQEGSSLTLGLLLGKSIAPK